MKKLFLIAFASVAFLTQSFAQTNDTALAPATMSDTPSTNAPSIRATLHVLADNLTTSSNWYFAAYMVYADSLKQHYGTGLGAYYKLSQYAATGVRLTWINGGAYGLSGNFSLKVPVDLFGRGIVTVTPMAYTEVATCISGMQVGAFTIPGKAPSNTSLIGIAGAGIILEFPKVKWMPPIVGGVEKWQGFEGQFYNIGTILHF